MSDEIIKIPDIGSDNAEVIEICVSPGDTVEAEDGIRDRSPSRGLGDVYKRQVLG